MVLTTTTTTTAAAAMSLHPLESAGAAGVQEMPRQQQQTQRVKQLNAVMNNSGNDSSTVDMRFMMQQLR
jgi:hypothetical protein